MIETRHDLFISMRTQTALLHSHSEANTMFSKPGILREELLRANRLV